MAIVKIPIQCDIKVSGLNLNLLFFKTEMSSDFYLPKLINIDSTPMERNKKTYSQKCLTFLFDYVRMCRADGVRLFRMFYKEN